MRHLRSSTVSAVLLLLAAIAALLVANSPVGPAVLAFLHLRGGLPVVGPDLSVEHWVQDLLLAVFFVTAAIELKHEFTHGSLDSWPKRVVPAAAALGGVTAPILIYVAIAGSTAPGGWPIPTATDIAFSLGVLALFGRGLPGRLRAFLLALAVIDDLVGILIIAVVFAGGLEIGMLVLAAILVVALVIASRLRLPGALRTVLLLALAVAIWWAVQRSGVHATIAGVAIGLALPATTGTRVRHVLEPVVNAMVLPIFAFVAALVVIPADAFGRVFVGIAIALPLGKIIGVTAGALIATAVAPGDRRSRIVGGDLVALAATAGIGFTVSLLMNSLAFEGNAAVTEEGVLGVLAGSLVSVVLGGILLTWRSRVHRRALRAQSPSRVR